MATDMPAEAGPQLTPEQQRHLDRMYFDVAYKAQQEGVRQRREFRAQVLAEVDAALRDWEGCKSWTYTAQHLGRGPSWGAIAADYLADTLGAGGDCEGS